MWLECGPRRGLSQERRLHCTPGLGGLHTGCPGLDLGLRLPLHENGWDKVTCDGSTLKPGKTGAGK